MFDYIKHFGHGYYMVSGNIVQSVNGALDPNTDAGRFWLLRRAVSMKHDPEYPKEYGDSGYCRVYPSYAGQDGRACPVEYGPLSDLLDEFRFHARDDLFKLLALYLDQCVPEDAPGRLDFDGAGSYARQAREFLEPYGYYLDDRDISLLQGAIAGRMSLDTFICCCYDVYFRHEGDAYVCDGVPVWITDSPYERDTPERISSVVRMARQASRGSLGDPGGLYTRLLEPWEFVYESGKGPIRRSAVAGLPEDVKAVFGRLIPKCVPGWGQDGVRALGRDTYLVDGRVIAVERDALEACTKEGRERLHRMAKNFGTHWYYRNLDPDLCYKAFGPAFVDENGETRYLGGTHRLCELHESIRAQLRKEFPDRADKI